MDAIRVVEARSGADYATARDLFVEYAAATGGHVCFQSYADELDALPSMYGPPQGCLLLAFAGAGALGCVALRPTAPGQCEMKRLYVRPEARGAGVGRMLTERLLERAAAAGYRRIVLDTLESMAAARGLYRSLGFAPRILPAADRQPGVAHMEMSLDPALGASFVSGG
jgi:ribosomal protein S18 acetylase RimI-like enzyme